jgi:hypothetical protein
VTSLSKPAGEDKPKGKTDKELVLQALRVESIRCKLIDNIVCTIGTALKQGAVDVEGALQWAKDEHILDALQLGPRNGGER